MKVIDNLESVKRRVGSMAIGETFLDVNGDLCSIFRNGNTSGDLYVNLTNNEAQKSVKVAEAARQSREQAAQASEREADAKLYAAQKEAEANKALQVTITPAMLDWQRLKVDEVRAKGWNGQLPTTVMGEGGNYLMDIRK